LAILASMRGPILAVAEGKDGIGPTVTRQRLV